MRNTPEILAPAGSMESLQAALYCGADAVYLGAKSFSARHSAENFDLPQLQEAVDLCHLFGAKLYLTVNTLLRKEEFPDLEKLIHSVARMGIDAVLVQDLGVMQKIHEIAPNLPIHASTQMSIHTPLGAKWAKEHGIDRVVLARELSRQEIQSICQEDIEIEQFVHGALCMSVSGQCGLSAIIGSRSANRGRCAQACRLPFTADGDKKQCALSLKDLSLVSHVSDMKSDGVASLKIEGRCKRPEYVAAAVTALIQERAGKKADLSTLQSVFSRSGFTEGYYTGRRENMFGVRRKEDVVSANDVFPQLQQLYRKVPSMIPIQMKVTLLADTPVQLIMTDSDGNTVEITGDPPQIAKNRPTDLEQLEKQLGKLGGTIYYLENLQAELDGKTILPASGLNALRREAVEQLNRKRIERNTPHYILSAKMQNSEPMAQTMRQSYRIQLEHWQEDCAELLAHKNIDYLILPISAKKEVPKDYIEDVILTLPRFCAKEEQLLQEITEASALGFSHIQCENVAHFQLCAMTGMISHGGLGMNVMNPYTAEFLLEQGMEDFLLSPELTVSQLKDFQGMPAGVYGFGNQPVMIMRNCPIKNQVGCQNCHHQLQDRTERVFPVYCDPSHGMTTMYNAVPTWMAEKQSAFSGMAYILLDCTRQKDWKNILYAYENHSPSESDFSRGLFYRGVE